MRDDLIRMAHEAGFEFHRYEGNVKESVNSLETLARLITAADREETAKFLYLFKQVFIIIIHYLLLSFYYLLL